jgi:zinc transport system permease protein
MWQLINYPVYASIFISIAIGIIGSLVVINKSTAITGSIAHGSFGGIGIGMYFGLNILLCTGVFTIVLAVILALISFYYRSRLDSLIGVIWAVGMSIGIIFISMTPGYHSDALSYLFGNILLIDKKDLFSMMIIDALLLISIIFLYHRFLAMSYDMDFLKVRGINSGILYTYFLILTSLTIVMSVKAIGIILILALFTIPPLIAEKFTKKFYNMMILSGILSLIFMISGILISFYYDVSPTPTIVIIAAIALILSLFKRN